MFDESEENFYIPSYLSAIGFAMFEGGYWHEWDSSLYGVVQSQHMPSGTLRQLGRLKVFAHALIVVGVPENMSIHAVLFERGYMWDCINGWRRKRLSDKDLEYLKQSWLFSK